jgi:predicted dehydrogenase
MTVNTAIVGLGWWGQHMAKIIERDDVPMRVAATVDTNPELGASHSDLGEVLDDSSIEAVILVTPNSLHSDLAQQIIAAGKHVFCEKPLTLNSSDARAMVQAANDAGIVLGVGHERRYEPAMIDLHRMITAGELGEILHVETSYSHDLFRALPADHWRGSLVDAPGAGMTAMAIHLTDLMIWMLGRVSTVYATVAHRVLDLPSGDVVSAQLHFEQGAIASMTSLSVTPFFGRFAVYGSEGWFITRDDAHPQDGGGLQIETCNRDDEPKKTHQAYVDTVHVNLTAWADAIEGRSSYQFTDFELVHNIEVLEAIVQSADLGQPVSTP